MVKNRSYGPTARSALAVSALIVAGRIDTISRLRASLFGQKWQGALSEMSIRGAE